MKLLISVTNKHALIKKMTVKTVKYLWIDEEFKKKCWLRGDEAKGMAKCLAAQPSGKRD
jgi:hypothetical protein